MYLNITSSRFLLTELELQLSFRKSELKLSWANNFSILQTAKENHEATCCNAAGTAGSNSGATLWINLGLKRGRGARAPQGFISPSCSWNYTVWVNNTLQ